jgi:xylulokinase
MAGERYVVGMDSSTQSVKAIAWTRDGMPRAEGRAPLDILQPQPLYAEQDARTWWEAASTALSAVTRSVDPKAIDAVAVSNQRETMVLVDEAGEPLAPATLWLDRRAREMVHVLGREIGVSELHRISGKPVDVIPCLYRLRWLREHDPDQLEDAAHILDVHGYQTMKLTGTPTASWTSADPFGIFDIAEKAWSTRLIDHLGIHPTQFPRLVKPGTQVGTVTAEAAARTGLVEGTPVIAAGGDGHCAGLGVNAITPGTVYLNLGTAVVGGLWSPTAELSPYWRTLTSPTGEGYLLESCQRAGAFFVNWIIDNFGGGRDDAAVFERLEAQAAKIPVGSEGVAVCPYLVGCMDPHWDEDARASFSGFGPEHTLGHLYRAALEAITLEFARAVEQMRQKGLRAERVLVIGGGASSPTWLKMVADSTGLPAIRCLSNEASALGAGISAAVGVGWYDGFHAAADAMTRLAEEVAPDPSTAEAWRAASRRQAAVYDSDRIARRGAGPAGT